MGYRVKQPKPLKNCIIAITTIAAIFSIAVGYFELADRFGWYAPDLPSYFVLPSTGRNSTAQRVMVETNNPAGPVTDDPVLVQRIPIAYSSYKTNGAGLIRAIGIDFGTVTTELHPIFPCDREGSLEEAGTCVEARPRLTLELGGYRLIGEILLKNKLLWIPETNNYQIDITANLSIANSSFAIDSEYNLLSVDSWNGESLETQPDVFEFSYDGTIFPHLNGKHLYRVSFVPKEGESVYVIPPLSGGYGYEICLPEGEFVVEIFETWPGK